MNIEDITEQDKIKLIKFCRDNLKFYIDANDLWEKTRGEQGMMVNNINKVKEQYALNDDILLEKMFQGEIVGIEKRA